MERQLFLELPNDLRCIEDTVEFVVSRCSICEVVDRKLRLNFQVSLIEALSNAMIYGNCSDPLKKVRVEVFLHEGLVTAQVTDEGSGFDPGCIPDPTTGRSVRKVSGRGLFLMKTLMDEVHYNDRGNSVKLVLHLSSPEGIRREASA